jgi:tetratricopeptide (TPR) repeat protein
MNQSNYWVSSTERNGRLHRSRQGLNSYSDVALMSLLLTCLLLAQPPRIQAQESASDKAKREEIQRRNAQITANNQIVQRTFTAGNAALTAGRYDEAIAQYNEGLAADPEQIALLVNKSIALRQRGVAQYNAALKAPDETAKASGKLAAGRDWREAYDSASRAVALTKADPSISANNSVAAYAARAEAGKLLLRVDSSVGDAVFKAFEEYVAVEPDEGKKLRGRNDGAQALIDGGLAERAVTEFRKLVNENPYNVDAILGLGMALFTTGDEARFKEAASYLQQFVKMAPDTHAKKAWARQTLRELAAYVQPEK